MDMRRTVFAQLMIASPGINFNSVLSATEEITR